MTNCSLCGKEQTYHGPDCLDSLAAWTTGRLARKQSAAFGWFGLKGSWKSSTAIQFCKLVNPDFDVNRQVVFSNQEFKVAQQVLPPGSMILKDEAIKAGENKGRHMTAENNDAVENTNTDRKLGHGIVKIMPFSDDQDKRQFKHLDYSLRMSRPGEGTCFEVQTFGMRKTGIWEEGRFDFKVQHTGELFPQMWADYSRRAENDARGQGDGFLLLEQRLKKNAAIARRVLRGLR
jgi:hypothetical protein